jgi:hypothetical protein
MGHQEDDEAFERALLRSARHDGPSPEATERAWAGLSAGLVAGLAAGTADKLPAVAAAKGIRLAHAASLLLAGALGGSALTYALLAPRAALPLVSPALIAPALGPSASSLPAGAAASGSARAPATSSLVAPLVPGGPVASAAPGVGRGAALSDKQAPSSARRVGPSRATTSEPGAAAPGVAASGAAAASEPGPARPEPAREPASSLAAEVAALDAARGDLARGAPGEARSKIERYFHDFPRGVLSQEAAAVRIEALAAQGERSGVVAEADRFLRSYPAAPQAPRIRQLRADAAR